MTRPLLSFVIFVLLSALLPALSWGEIVPTDRRTTWQGNVGVPGGIPNRTVIYRNLVTDSGADNTGVADCTAILQNAMNSCPDSQVIYLPAGTYRINGCIFNPSHPRFTIRGAGMGKTILDLHGSSCNGVIDIGSQDWPPPTANIVIQSGATAGSTSVTCVSPTGVSAGKLIRIDQDNLTWVKSLNGDPDRMSFLFKVTGVSGNTVSFWPPLPFTMTNSPKVAVYTTNAIEGVGIEDLTLDMQNGPDAGSAVFFEQAYGCWLKNVEVAHSSHRQVWLTTAMNCEIRHCYIHDVQSFSSNREGIDLYENACWNLIEDNISVRGGYPMIVLGDWKGRCSANVIAYNYCEDAQSGSTVAGSAISDNHGGHNMMNLYEGNVGQMFESDGYWGSSSHGTLLRNWFSGKYSDQLYNHVAVKLNHFASYYNIVGNILGHPAETASYESEVQGFPATLHLIYRLGFPFIGSSNYNGTIPISAPPNYTQEPGDIGTEPQRFDPNVRGTVIRHGNYDFATRNLNWDPMIVDRSIPNSYYLTSKPSWFGALTWPAFDSTKASALDSMMIPAQFRYLHRIDPPLQVRSRKVHGTVGTFDIDLPLSGTPGVECRSGGATGDYKIVTTFTTPITWASAVLTAGFGSVKNDRGTATVDGANVTVELENVTSGQVIEIEINGLTADGTPFDIDVPMRMLVGDVTGNGSVNSSDVSLTKSQAGRVVNQTNFRQDVTVSGSINASDISLVKSRSGTSTP